MADIATNIKIQRLNKGLDQAQLAERLSITTQTLSSWENGSSFPDIKTLEQLARELGIEIESLIYPHSYDGTKHESKSPLSFKFILLSVILYSILLVFGGGLFAIPLLKSIVGGGTKEEFILVVYWGLILLVGYIGLCIYLLSRYIQAKDSDSG